MASYLGSDLSIRSAPTVKRRIIFSIALLILCTVSKAYGDAAPASPLPTPSVVAGQIVVPRGTLIRVKIDEELDGYRNLAGSKLHFTVLESVKIGGSDVVQKGDIGIGIIQDGGHGILKISVDKIYTFCGDALDMNFEFTAPDRRRAFARGALSQIHKNTEFEPVTLRLQRVCASS